jgi:hypothetical protein
MLLSFHFGNRAATSVSARDVVSLLAGRRVLALSVAGKRNQTVQRRVRNLRNGEIHNGHTHHANGMLSNSTALKVAEKSAQLSRG